MKAIGFDDIFDSVYSIPAPDAERSRPRRLSAAKVQAGLGRRTHYAFNQRGPKADPHSYRMIARIEGFKPEEMLMVGDNLLRDVTTANAAGLQTAFAQYGLEEKSDLAKKSAPVTWGHNNGLKPAEPTIRLDRPLDLLDRVSKLKPANDVHMN